MAKSPVTLMQGLVNPFSDKFLETWALWKEYKLETHGFRYKGLFSEQVKLGQLFDMSGGDEEKAKEIIMQSIGNQWEGLYHIKNNNNGQRNNNNAGKTIEFDKP